jgi:Domain of unknown function (DUF4062)
MKVYLSSTYLDLRKHRETVALALRKAGYDVVMMEEYVARDEITEFACQGDVARCDAYVGIFAWRYGYIPEDNNPTRKSVTELEYSAAERDRILVFLLRDNARWPKNFIDADLTRIGQLRARLKKTCAAYFSSKGELAVEILAALRVLEATRFARQLDAVVEIQTAQHLGPSYLMNIKEKLVALCETALIEIHTAPTPWWNTRLHLVAALAQEIGGTAEFVFVDADRRFLTMAPPAEIRRRLAQRWPELEAPYALFRKGAPTLESIGHNLDRYPAAVSASFRAEEINAKEVVMARDLEHDLGIISEAETVEVADKGQRFLQREILGRRTPFAALVRDGRLEGLVDTQDLARRVADKALART